jgi:hypothetical protein
VTNIGHTIRRRISSGAASPVQVEAIASELGVRGQVPATAVPLVCAVDRPSAPQAR